MKTIEELNAMTKAAIVAYGNETFGTNLDSSLKKGELITQITDLQAQKTPDDPEPPTAPEERPVTQSKSTVDVTVINSNFTGGANVFVNGRAFNLPIGQKVNVPANVLPVLDAAGVEYIQE